jgi:hypothetical protein
MNADQPSTQGSKARTACLGCLIAIGIIIILAAVFVVLVLRELSRTGVRYQDPKALEPALALRE